MSQSRIQYLPRPSRRSGFTLLELIVCIAMALVLMLGVNQVFSLTSRTISTSQAFSELHRDIRAATTIIAQDAQGAAASDGPFFLIRSATLKKAWRNAEDQNTGNAALREDHRNDRLAFFARGIFKRVTGDKDFVDDMTAPEAYIWYGLVRQPGPTKKSTATFYQDFQDPGAGTKVNNPNNFYASQWILGREAILLREKNSAGKINGSASGFYDRPKTATDLSPLSENTQGTSTLGAAINKTPLLQWSRFDLAATSIDGYRQILLKKLTATPAFNWWNGVGNFYYEANPHPLKPYNSENIAALAPVFLEGCTDFAVEFAGDFCTQDDTGAFTKSDPDNIIDFEYDAVNKVRKVRWYGMTPTYGPLKVTHSTVAPVGTFTGTAPRFERSTGATYVAAWDMTTDQDSAPAPLSPRPKMLRITMILDDVSARISGGQIFEFVLPLQ